jgi:hypothetical protein
MIRIFGFSKLCDFPCLCYGKRGYFLKIRFIRGKGFRVYKGHLESSQLLTQGNPVRVFGLVVMNNYSIELFDD